MSDMLPLYDIPKAADNTFTFWSDSKMLFAIQQDGTIVPGPGFTTIDEMSLKFWEGVNSLRGVIEVK
jgi:hypothetical protein